MLLSVIPVATLSIHNSTNLTESLSEAKHLIVVISDTTEDCIGLVIYTVGGELSVSSSQPMKIRTLNKR